MLPVWPAHFREVTAREQQHLHCQDQMTRKDSSCHTVSARLVKIESKKRRGGEGNTVCTQRRLVLTPTTSAPKPELRCQYESERTSVKQLMQNHLAHVSKSKAVSRWKHHQETGDCVPEADESNSVTVTAGTVPMPQDNITVKPDDNNDLVPKPVPSTTVTAIFSNEDLRGRDSIVFDLAWRECDGNHKCMRGKALAMALSRHLDGKEADSIVMGCPGGTTSRDPTITCLEVDKMGSLVAAGSIDGNVVVYVDIYLLTYTQR